MPNSTTPTSITDRALQLLGMASISSPQQVGSRGAKSILRAYEPVKLSELQKHFWHFSIKRAKLTASGTPPVHTKNFSYPLPGDYLMLAPSDQYGEFPEKHDWIVEGGEIISDESGPLLVRYVSSSITEALFDAIFAEAMAAALAMACCEELTNSQSKLDRVSQLYDFQINEAKKRGSILVQKNKIPASSWITART